MTMFSYFSQDARPGTDPFLVHTDRYSRKVGTVFLAFNSWPKFWYSETTFRTKKDIMFTSTKNFWKRQFFKHVMVLLDVFGTVRQRVFDKNFDSPIEDTKNFRRCKLQKISGDAFPRD